MQVDNDVYSVVDGLNDAKSEAEVLQLVRQFSKANGYDHFIISGLPPRGVNVLPFVLLSDWPSIWHERYFGRDYTQFDPVARNCFHSVLPFFWKEAPYDREDDHMARRVMDEASDAGLLSGFCVPVHNEDGSQGCVSFGGREADIDQEKRLGLHMVSAFAHGRLRAFHRPYQLEKAPKLTEREIEVLKWASHGKSTSDIGDLLNIADVTVDAHVKSAARKLGTLNRVHTVAEALRYRLIPL
jgi:LuxR family quorum sensing-dependent transcriptional regulator